MLRTSQFLRYFLIVALMAEQEATALRPVDERSPTMLRDEFKKMLAAARRPQGDPHEATAQCGGGASSGAKGSHAAQAASIQVFASQQTPKRAFSPKSRTGSQAGRRGPFRAESACRRPAGEQTPRKTGLCLLGESIKGGTPLQLLRGEVASVRWGRDHRGSGAIAPGKELDPRQDRSRLFVH